MSWLSLGDGQRPLTFEECGGADESAGFSHSAVMYPCGKYDVRLMSVLSKWKPRWLAIFCSMSTSSSSRFVPQAASGAVGVFKKSRYTFQASTTERVPLSVP